MASTPNINSITTANTAYLSTGTHRSLPLPPSKQLTIVTCMDARLLPSSEPTLGVKAGEAHIIRNAGGSARDALRSLIISQHLLNTDEIAVIKHTDCGMLTFEDADAEKLVLERQGAGARGGVEAVKQAGGFRAFGDLEGEVKRDVDFLRGEQALRARDKISGWVWEVETGKLRRIV